MTGWAYWVYMGYIMACDAYCCDGSDPTSTGYERGVKGRKPSTGGREYTKN